MNTDMTVVSVHAFGVPAVSVERVAMSARCVNVRIGDLSLFLESQDEARRVADAIIAGLAVLKNADKSLARVANGRHDLNGGAR